AFQPSATLLPDPFDGIAPRSGFPAPGSSPSGPMESGVFPPQDRYAEDSASGIWPPVTAGGISPEESFHPENASGLPTAALGAALAVLLLAAGGVWWGYRHFARSPAGDVRVHLETYPAQGNSAGTGDGLASDAAAGGRERGQDHYGTGKASADAEPAATEAGGHDPVREIPFRSDSVRSDGGTGKPDPGRGDLAYLLLKSAPPFVEAFIDGQYLGVTPLKVDQLVPGRHRMILKPKGAPAFDTTLAVKPGVQEFKFNLDPGPHPRLAVTPEAEP
ncbi:MAG: PEGA domain-containing protein, partial [Fibrobacteria bacterium]